MNSDMPKDDLCHSRQDGAKPPGSRTIVICDENPVLADGIRQVLQHDSLLSGFRILADQSPDLAALATFAPDILILDPWQSIQPHQALSEVFLELSAVTSLIGYCPEFLRESTAIDDYDNSGLIVFGALDAPTFAILTLLNKDRPCVSHEVDLRTAEMVKYTSNTWRGQGNFRQRDREHRQGLRSGRAVGD